MANQFPCTHTLLTTADSGWRDVKTVRVGVFHTTENSDDTPATNVAKWQQNRANGSSYNVLFGTDGTTVRSNDDDYTPWAAYPSGNRIGFHGSAIGRASRTREQWLAHPKQINAMTAWAADLHKRYGLPLVWLTPEQVRNGHRGFCGHYEISLAFRESDHTDPGRGFPHDVILAKAKEIANGSTLTEPKGKLSMSDVNTIMNELREVKATQKEILRQLGQPGGWPQGGNRTLYDMTAAVAEKQGVPGTFDTLAEKKES